MPALELGQEGVARLKAGVVAVLADQGRGVRAEPFGPGAPSFDPELVAIEPEPLRARAGGRTGGPPGARRGDPRGSGAGQRPGQVKRPPELECDRDGAHSGGL